MYGTYCFVQSISWLDHSASSSKHIGTGILRHCYYTSQENKTEHIPTDDGVPLERDGTYLSLILIVATNVSTTKLLYFTSYF